LHRYEKLVPKAEPVEEWEDRILLYEAYVEPTTNVVLHASLIPISNISTLKPFESIWIQVKV